MGIYYFTFPNIGPAEDYVLGVLPVLYVIYDCRCEFIKSIIWSFPRVSESIVSYPHMYSIIEAEWHIHAPVHLATSVQIVASRLTGAKTLSAPIFIVNLALGNSFHRNLNRNAIILTNENCFENIAAFHLGLNVFMIIHQVTPLGQCQRWLNSSLMLWAAEVNRPMSSHS